MKPKLRDYLKLSGKKKQVISKKCISLGAISLCLSLLLSTYTEGFIRPGVIIVFNAIKGKGFTASPSIEIKLDEKGIPITLYPDLGSFRNPVNIAQQGLTYLHEGKWELLLNIAEYFVNNASYRDDFVVWEYTFPWEFYNMNPPWISGMAQGLAVEVLGHAYDLTGKQIYKEIADKALRAFLVPIEEGGVTIDTGNGRWYEEYADIGGKNPRVLNGMIYALQGIYNFWLITGNEEAKMIFDKGVIALKQNLPIYDAWGWSYYDALGNVASDEYHRIHVEQMKWLYEVTRNPMFADYAADWENDLTSPFRFFLLVLLRGPQESDIVILLVNTMLTFFFIQGLLSVLKKIKVRVVSGKNKGC